MKKILDKKKWFKAFDAFIDHNDGFSDNDRSYLRRTMKHKRIRVIFRLTMYLVLWSFLAMFIDAFLATRGVLGTVGEGGVHHFLPTLIFLLVNATLKFSFIYFYLKNRIKVPTYYILIGVIPIVGSLFITGILLKKEKRFFKALKAFVKYYKKHRMDGVRSLLHKHSKKQP